MTGRSRLVLGCVMPDLPGVAGAAFLTTTDQSTAYLTTTADSLRITTTGGLDPDIFFPALRSTARALQRWTATTGPQAAAADGDDPTEDSGEPVESEELDESENDEDEGEPERRPAGCWQSRCGLKAIVGGQQSTAAAPTETDPLLPATDSDYSDCSE